MLNINELSIRLHLADLKKIMEFMEDERITITTLVIRNSKPDTVYYEEDTVVLDKKQDDNLPF